MPRITLRHFAMVQRSGGNRVAILAHASGKFNLNRVIGHDAAPPARPATPATELGRLWAPRSRARTGLAPSSADGESNRPDAAARHLGKIPRALARLFG